MTASQEARDRRTASATAGHPAPGAAGVSAAAPAAAPRVDCLHCGLPLSRSQRAAGDRFCCRGCETVHGLLHEQGLARFYDLRHGRGTPPAELRPDHHAWLDPVLDEARAPSGGELVRLRLDVQGIHCAACVWLLERLFARHAAGRQLRINPALGTVELVWDLDRGDLRDYLADVERFGYRFGPPRKETGRRGGDLTLRMGVAIAAALNVMMFSLAFYFGLAPADGAVYRLFGRLNLGLAAIAVLVGGWPFLRAAVAGLRRRVVHLDLPIALGMLLGLGGSIQAYATGGPEAAYFDTVAVFAALMLVGRWLQERVLERNRNALLSSAGVADLHARRFASGRLDAVPAALLRTGDELWIAPGDLVPVAGVLLRDGAAVSLDWITGESAARTCAPGDAVPAGAFNVGRRGFRLAATEDFAASRLNVLLAAGDGTADDGVVAAAPESAARPRRDLWHRVATVYVTTVLALAAGGFLLWLGHGSRKAIEVAVAVLVVTCPCALGLAVPLARELVQAYLRRHGVLLRRGGFLERALDVRRVLFDKTGTLTRGRLALTAPARRALLALPPRERGILWNMTARSNHPVSRCVTGALDWSPRGRDGAVAAAAGAAALDPAADAVRELAGRGLAWRRDDGLYRLGRPGFALGGDGAAGDGAAGDGAAGDGATDTVTPGVATVDAGNADATLFTRDGRILAALAFEEDLRPDAADEVAALEAAGFEVHLLSGDAPVRAAAAAARLGIAPERVRGGLDPEQKAAAVRALDRRDTLMAGDGLNDSPSFDAAHCTATPAVDRAHLPAKADLYYLGDGVGAVRRALLAARRLRSVQRGNLWFAALYNAPAVGLALAGLVTPVVAAVLMPLSSITIVTITTLRLAERRLA